VLGHQLTPQVSQEQELQSPEQQLQVQGDILADWLFEKAELFKREDFESLGVEVAL